MPEFELGEWSVDSQGGTFSRDGHKVHVEPRVMDVLICLVEAGNEVVGRESLLETVWGNVVVSEEALTRCISELRTLLGDTGRQRRYIRTVPKRGYALIVPAQGYKPEKPESEVITVESIPISQTSTSNSEPQDKTGKDPRWLFASMVAAAVAAFFIYLSFAPRELIKDSPMVAQQTQEVMTASRLAIPDDKPSLAVLPFSNLSPATEHRYVAEALTEDLRSDLTKTNALRVAARTSSLVFRDKALDIREIGRLLNVSQLVEGSVRVENDTLRITVQLTDARTGYQVWSEVFERSHDDIRGLDLTIAEALMLQIVPANVVAEIPEITHPQNSEAYTQYLLGRYYAYQVKEDSREKAIAHFTAAIDLDVAFGRAYAALAQVYMDSRHSSEMYKNKSKKPGVPLQEVLAVAEPLVNKAVELESSSGEVLAARGRLAHLQDEPDLAIEIYNQALEANPSMPMTRLALAELLVHKDEVNLAFNQYTIALQTDPLHPRIQKGFLWGLMSKGEYVDTIRYADQFFEQSKDVDLLSQALHSHVLIGQFDKALSYAQRFSSSIDFEKSVAYRVIEALYFLQRFEEGDALREQYAEHLSPYSQAVIEVNKGVSLRDADIVYRAADMLDKSAFESPRVSEACVKPYSEYWRAYGAYLERDYVQAVQFFEKSEADGFMACMRHAELQVSFPLYYSHALQQLGDKRFEEKLKLVHERLDFFTERGWGGSRLNLYNVALNLVEGNFGQANEGLLKLREQAIEPFGMIFAEPIFDEFYGNKILEPALTLARQDFEDTRKRSEEQHLVKFGL